MGDGRLSSAFHPNVPWSLTPRGARYNGVSSVHESSLMFVDNIAIILIMLMKTNYLSRGFQVLLPYMQL